MRSTKTPLTTVAALLLLLAAGTAHAKDLCVHRSDGSILAVLRGFKAPLRNKCRSVTGTHANGMLSGTVCRTGDGATLRFGTTTNVSAGLFATPKVREHSFNLAYPAYDSGSGSEFTIDGGAQVSTTQVYLPPLYADFCTPGDIS